MAGTTGGSKSLSSPAASEVMEIRLTEVSDVTSFWAQIGTGIKGSVFFLLYVHFLCLSLQQNI